VLHSTVAREIINLEDDKACPSFNKLPWQEKYCLQHALKTPHLQYSCALNNAYRLKTWLKSCDTESFLNADSDLFFIPPTQLCDEQSGNSERAVIDPIAFRWSVPCRSNSPGVDETDRDSGKH